MDTYIQWMIDWMEERMRERFSLEDLADYMGYSPYYCSFKFHQLTGISIRRYILLRRLYLSTEDLIQNRRIIDIAMDYGYSSQESYSRAFKTAFGLNPKEFQLHPQPVQSFTKIIMQQGDVKMSREVEVKQLKDRKQELFDQDVLNILNGQVMYDEFNSKKLMGMSDYVPFNEAMCVHQTSVPVFDDAFIQMRASGHRDTVESYRNKVIKPLCNLFEKDYNYIVLWFGEDVFCQMNALTILAYLEQSRFKGKVFLNSFREDEFKVSQTEVTLGKYATVYEKVLIQHQRPSIELLPVMYQAVNLFLEMQTEDNPVIKYIVKHKHLPTSELLQKLFALFPMLGYGDTQYLELIKRYK
ncbi:helix-turn-helix transcriptional regulator [Virgibacillus soli]|uniref:helix-turn-helix transcriptional regulator n=1 Tax=Paracerasibacillus soli TaxID=480284 RepID=UPI0035E745D6